MWQFLLKFWQQNEKWKSTISIIVLCIFVPDTPIDYVIMHKLSCWAAMSIEIPNNNISLTSSRPWMQAKIDSQKMKNGTKDLERQTVQSFCIILFSLHLENYFASFQTKMRNSTNKNMHIVRVLICKSVKA